MSSLLASLSPSLMHRLLFVLVVSISLAACSSPEEDTRLIVDLVPSAEIVRVLPSEVDSFVVEGDTSYRGYMASSPRGAYAVSTVARIYATPSGNRISLNVSSFDNRSMFLAAYGEDAVRDTTVATESYDVLLGRVVMASDYHAIEGRGFDSLAVRRAIDLVDLDALAAMPRVPIEIDSTFLRR